MSDKNCQVIVTYNGGNQMTLEVNDALHDAWLSVKIGEPSDALKANGCEYTHDVNLYTDDHYDDGECLRAVMHPLVINEFGEVAIDDDDKTEIELVILRCTDPEYTWDYKRGNFYVGESQ